MVTTHLGTPALAAPRAEEDSLTQLLWSMRDQNRALQTQNEALREQVRALTTTNQALVAALNEQMGRIRELGERVTHLSQEIDVLRTDRNTAVEQNAENAGASVARAAQIYTQTEELRIAHLQARCSQLLLRQSYLNDFVFGTQAISAGAGALSGAFWGGFLGPVGAIAGLALGATAIALTFKEDIEAKILNERNQIETELRQIRQQLAFSGRT